MSFDFPANIERDIERYARSKHITPSEAAVQLIEDGLRANEKKPNGKRKVSQEDLEVLREKVPLFAFLDTLPDDVAEAMEETSKEIRAERFVPRG